MTTKTRMLLFVGVLALWPVRADAMWGWLEEFSGPGPFGGGPPGILVTACYRQGFRPSPLLGQGSAPSPRSLPCLYFDKTFFSAEADQRFPEIHVRHNDFGGAVRLVDGLDIGAGFGWMTFDSSVAKRRFTLTPIRIVIRPLLLALPESLHTKWKVLGALSIYWKEVFVDGPITGADFGVDAAKFDSRGELVRSFGVVIDVTSLFGDDWKFHTPGQ